MRAKQEEQSPQPFQEDFFLHFKHKVVKDRVRQALYKPGGLTPYQERQLFAHANFVEILAWYNLLPQALKALGEFIKYSDSIMGTPQEK